MSIIIIEINIFYLANVILNGEYDILHYLKINLIFFMLIHLYYINWSNLTNLKKIILH